MIDDTSERNQHLDQETSAVVLLVVLDWGRSYVRAGVGGPRPTFHYKHDFELYQTTSFGRVPLKLHEYVTIAEKVLSHVFNVGLPVVYEHDTVVDKVAWITGSLELPTAMLQALAIVLMSDQYGFEALCHIPTPGAVLSAYPIQTGLIVDISGIGTSICGVVGGHIIKESVLSLKSGGDLITKTLRYLVKLWYQHCGDIFLQKINDDRRMKALSDEIESLKPDWRFAREEDLDHISWEEWNDIKAACVYVNDGVVGQHGNYHSDVDANIPLNDGRKMVVIPHTIRSFCSEMILWDNLETTYSSHRRFIDEDCWQSPWSQRLTVEEELPFFQHISTLEGDIQGIGQGERLFRHMRRVHISDDGCPREDNMGIIRGIITALESSGNHEGPMVSNSTYHMCFERLRFSMYDETKCSQLCQNIVLCGGSSELMGLRNRIMNEIKQSYLYAKSKASGGGTIDHVPSRCEDPFPEPSARMGKRLDSMKFGKSLFSGSLISWIGCSVNSDVVLRQEILQTAIRHYKLIYTQIPLKKAATHDANDSALPATPFDGKHRANNYRLTLSDIKLIESLSTQLIFRRSFEHRDPNHNFATPDFSLSKYEKSRSTIDRIYEPGYELLWQNNKAV